VEAICINQEDYKERGHQVGQMGKIYQRAQSVTVWLGPSEHRSDAAMDLIRQMSKNTAKSRDESAVPSESLHA
jgi:Heterokaryon incompatibility protein (HET)